MGGGGRPTPTKTQSKASLQDPDYQGKLPPGDPGTRIRASISSQPNDRTSARSKASQGAQTHRAAISGVLAGHLLG